MVEVRRAVPEDAAAIAAVHVRSWQAVYRGLMPDQLLDGLRAAEREPMWRAAAAGEAGPGVLLVAELGGELIGFCAVGERSRDEDAGPDVAEIGAIYVDPTVWRSGAGSALMDAALAHLRSRQRSRELTLWVLDGNQLALDFYRRFGFAPDGAEQLHERSGATEIRLRRSL